MFNRNGERFSFLAYGKDLLVFCRQLIRGELVRFNYSVGAGLFP